MRFIHITVKIIRFSSCCFTFFILVLFCPSLKAQVTDLVPYRKGALWGYANPKGQVVIPCRFEAAQPFLFNLAKVRKNGKWGLINRDGSTFLPCLYDIVYGSATSGRIVVCLGGDKQGHGGIWGMVPRFTGQPIPLLYNLLRECDLPGSVGAMKNGLWGTLNEFGKISISPQFQVEAIIDHQFSFQDTPQLQIAAFKETASLPRPYVKLRFVDEMARVKKNGKWGYIDQYGQPAIPLIYDFVGDFSEDYLTVVKKDKDGLKMGVVDHKNRLVIPFVYEISPERYRQQRFSEGLIALRKNGRWGYVNARDKIIIPFQYAQAREFREGRAAVSHDNSSLNRLWEFIDERGDKVFSLSPDQQLLDLEFLQGFVRVVRAGKMDFLNRQGKLLCGFKYDKVWPFREGRAQVLLKTDKGPRIGYIDERGREIIAPEYDFPKEDFQGVWRGSLVRLRKAGKYGLLDEDRTVMIDFLYDDLLVPPGKYPDSFLREGLLAVKQDSLWGFINFREKQVIPFRYDQVEPFEDGYARVKYQGQWGYINRRGLEYFEE